MLVATGELRPQRG